MQPALRSLGATAALAGSRRAAVARAEAYIREHATTPLRVSSICQVAGLSERGPRSAFYDVHGQSPKRWMLTVRLQEVRRALAQSPGSAATVTGIAIQHGFNELGRFAATYRDAFGEAPSETLRKRTAKPPARKRPPRKGDGQC
jgi:transcriptional regulator GlxA family with amidase domain